MTINKKINTITAFLSLLFVGLFVIGVHSVTVYAGTSYSDCYKKSQNKQKDCLQSAYNDACKGKSGNKKETCQQEESAQLDTAFAGAVSQCMQQQKLTKKECKDKYISPTQVGGYVNGEGGDGQPSVGTGINETYSNTAPVAGAPSEQEVHDYKCVPNDTEKCLQDNPIVKWLNVLINVMTGVVGVGAVLMIVVGGIQYITSRDNAQGVAAAKQKIVNVVIGLSAFIFLWAFLQWLIPGGVFK